MGVDAFIGHRLGFKFANHPKYEGYLRDVIRATMQYIEGGHRLGIGQRLCYQYWENKRHLFWNMAIFRENVTIPYLRSHFITENVVETASGYYGAADDDDDEHRAHSASSS